MESNLSGQVAGVQSGEGAAILSRLLPSVRTIWTAQKVAQEKPPDPKIRGLSPIATRWRENYPGR